MRDKGKKHIKPFLSYGVIRLFVILSVFFVMPSLANAHKVYLFAWAEGDTVHTESYFSDNKKINDGLIRVFDPSGKEILNGKTNEMGEFSFDLPQKTDMRIVLESSMGHGAEYIFKVSEFSDMMEDSEEKTESMEPRDLTPYDSDRDMGQIKTMIEEALDSRLGPISRELARLQEEKGPGLTEIIGGIGYILGIMGLVLYLRARKK
ncbi:hypothetical protein OAC89_06650 [Deltaproteobacteria bacterium]|nr:hypothetical protein [Deltaproteobacteria bacterium]